jgi:hypothetical protein
MVPFKFRKSSWENHSRYIHYEKEENAVVDKQMTSEEVEQWIENAEDSPNMSLEVFTKNENRKKHNPKALFPNN